MGLVYSTASLAGADADDCSAVQYAKNFYNQHYSFFAESEPQMIDQLYTAEFGAIISDHAEYVGDNGICELNFDPWLDAQWSVNENYELVLSFDKPGKNQEGEAQFVREDVIWRVPEHEYQ